MYRALRYKFTSSENAAICLVEEEDVMFVKKKKELKVKYYKLFLTLTYF